MGTALQAIDLEQESLEAKAARINAGPEPIKVFGLPIASKYGAVSERRFLRLCHRAAAVAARQSARRNRPLSAEDISDLAQDVAAAYLERAGEDLRSQTARRAIPLIEGEIAARLELPADDMPPLERDRHALTLVALELLPRGEETADIADYADELEKESDAAAVAAAAAEYAARQDLPPLGRNESPFCPATRQALQLVSPELSTNERRCVRYALAQGRATYADWSGRRDGAPTEAAMRRSVSRGRLEIGEKIAETGRLPEPLQLVAAAAYGDLVADA